MPSLFDPLQVGELTLPNRILLAPLTRTRAGDVRVPNALMVEYYRQRAEAGLILTEATSISQQGVGYPRTPGIWSEAQVEGWKLVTQAVHEAGGRIVLQLWHVGRDTPPTTPGRLQHQRSRTQQDIPGVDSQAAGGKHRRHTGPRTHPSDDYAWTAHQSRPRAALVAMNATDTL